MRGFILLCGLLSCTAHAQDEYYSIQSNDALAKIGGMTATGFIETNGFGSSNAGNPLVIGFDITLTGGGQTATLCGGVGYGCQQNDEVDNEDEPQWITATKNGLFCTNAACVLTDIGVGPGTSSAFWVGNGIVQTQIGKYIPAAANPYFFYNSGNYAMDKTRFRIAGGAPTTYNPLAVAEMPWAHAIEAIILLSGIALVVRARSA